MKSIPICLIALTLSSAPSLAQTPAVGHAVTTLFTNLPGHPTADVPGMPGAHFAPGTGSNHFDRVYGSPGGHWALTADTDLPAGADEVLIANGDVLAVEGGPALWTGGAEAMRTFDTRIAVNDDGDCVFTQSTDGPSSSNDYVVRVSGGVFMSLAQEGDPVPGLAGATFDDSLTTAVILASGEVGFEADGIDGGGATTASDELLMLGAAQLVRTGDVPLGQVGSAPWEHFDLNDYWVTPDGAHWLVQGDLDTGASGDDDVVAFDGMIVVQEGQPVAGSGSALPVDSDGINGVHLDASGHWFVRGQWSGSDDFVMRSGQLLAQSGAPIALGMAEAWGSASFPDGYFLTVGNSRGDYVIGGMTDADGDRNAVLVMNGEVVIAREGDPLDLDGDGLFNDDAYFDVFGTDDAFLSDAGELYIVATLRDSFGLATGQGLFVISSGALGASFCTSTTNSSGASALISASGSTSIAKNDFCLAVGTLPADAPGIFFYGTTQLQVPFGNGFRCVGGTVFQLWPATSADAAGRMTKSVDLTQPPGGFVGGGQVQAGASWNFQAWFREPGPVAGTNAGFDLSDGLEVTFAP